MVVGCFIAEDSIVCKVPKILIDGIPQDVSSGAAISNSIVGAVLNTCQRAAQNITD